MRSLPVNGLRGAGQRELHCGSVQSSIKIDVQCVEGTFGDGVEWLRLSLVIQQFIARSRL